MIPKQMDRKLSDRTLNKLIPQEKEDRCSKKKLIMSIDIVISNLQDKIFQ